MPATGFRDAAMHWGAAYRAAYGVDYPFRGRCNAHLRDILADVGSVEAFKQVTAAFLADRWPGYDGHELKHLWRDLLKFRVRAAVGRPAIDVGTRPRRQQFQDN